MNWYQVQGVRFVDMCGNSEEIDLGIIQLEKNCEFFKSKRPSEIGVFIYNNQQYHTFLFNKVKILKSEELNRFEVPRP